MKLGIVADCIRENKEIENLKLIKEHGFQSFFSSEKEYGVRYVADLKNEAVKLGLNYEFIHGPFVGINEMWTSQEDPKIFFEFQEAIDAAHNAGVQAVVAHVSSGRMPPQISSVGLERFDTWVEYATKKGVVLAFENLRKLGNFAYLMDRYEKEDYVKYCYDCGHEHCYTRTVPFLPIYGNRLLCTHLHDNFGANEETTDGGDLHLLPFDGNIDFQKVMGELSKTGYQGSLMLEVFNERYSQLSPDEFLQDVYARAKKLSDYFMRERGNAK